MTKLLLINPYIKSLIPTSLSEPLGLVSLATYLRSSLDGRINIEILDLYAQGNGEIREKVDKYVIGLSEPDIIIEKTKKISPDIIGIHCNFTTYAEGAFETANLLHKGLPEVPIVMGGAHASMDAVNILRNYPSVKFVVRGEGEITLQELLKVINRNTEDDMRNIDGLCFRSEKGEIVINKERPLIKDINILPVPDRSYIDMEFYKRMNSNTFAFSKNSPVITLMASRGCPYNCIFCSTKTMWKRIWRPFDAERIVDEVKYLVNNYGAREIAFLDDQFLLDRERVELICDHIIEAKYNITLTIQSGSSIWLLDDKMLKKLKSAGFYRLLFPIESGNENTLEFIRKPIKLEDIKKKIEMANQVGFWTAGNFIIGFPYETREEMMDTIRFACRSKLDFVVFLIAKAYAGSDLTEILRKEGLLRKELDGSDLLISDCDTKNLTSSEIQEMHSYAIRRLLYSKLAFYLNPFNIYRYLWPKMKSVKDFKYAIKVVYVGVKRIVVPTLRNRTMQLAGPLVKRSEN